MEAEGFINTVYYGNTIANYLLCLGILAVGYLFRNIVSRSSSKLFFRLFQRFSKNKFSEEFVSLLKTPLKVLFELIFVYIAFSPLSIPVEWNIAVYKGKTISWLITILYDLALVTSITWILLRTIDFVSLVLMEKALQTEDTTDDQLVGFFKELIKFVTVILSFFFVLGAIFNLNIAALVTGLGIGGLAIALAAQETLSNLLASFIIFLDKPFKAGDLVSVTDITGKVEKVGFRSTRIRTLDKSLLTVPNKKMIDSPLNNISLSSFRRVKFTIGLLYSTKATQLKQICAEIQAYLETHDLVDEDITVKFGEYGASSLNIQVVFFVKTHDWNVMMEVKEAVNYKVMEIVENNNSGFAYPTQTLYVEKKDTGT